MDCLKIILKNIGIILGVVSAVIGIIAGVAALSIVIIRYIMTYGLPDALGIVLSLFVVCVIAGTIIGIVECVQKRG